MSGGLWGNSYQSNEGVWGTLSIASVTPGFSATYQPTAQTAGGTTGGAAVAANLNQPQGEYGAAIPISMGTRRVGPPQLLWAKPIYGDATSGYFADFAFAWGFNGDSDPSATGITKLWANGAQIWDNGTKLLPGDWSVTLYTGTETQEPDPTITAAGGAATGYRNLMYGVFTKFPITQAWNFSIPGITAEISGSLNASFYVIRATYTDWSPNPGTTQTADLLLEAAFTDLDASVNGQYVGHFASYNVGRYLYFREDFSGGSGTEEGFTVYVDLAAIKADFPAAESVTLDVRAAWSPYVGATDGTGTITLMQEHYSGGAMVAGTGGYVNSGGNLTSSSSEPLTVTTLNPDRETVATPTVAVGDVSPAGSITIPQLINRIAEYAGLDIASDISIDPAIDDTAAGAIIGATTDFGDFAQNLGRFFGFDTFESDTIAFVRPVVGSTYTVDKTIPPADLLNDGDRAITTTRGDDTSPVLLEGKYIDESQQFRFNTQRARRILYPVRSTDSNRRLSMAVPVVLTANECMTYLGRAIYRMAAQNVLHQFSLPPRYLDIEPGDILSITAGGRTYIVKVSSVEIGPQLAISVKAVNLYTDETMSLAGESGTPLGTYDGSTVPAVLTNPTISGTPGVGNVLTATDGTFSNSAAVTRQWQSSTDGTTWANITGETSTTYTIQSADTGKRIRVKDTGTAGGKTAVSYSNSLTVPASSIVCTASPVITGTAKQGVELTTTVGTWTGTDPVTDGIVIDWLDDADNVLKSTVVFDTTDTFTPTSGTLIGHTIRVRATDWQTETVSSYSAPTSAVVAGDPQLKTAADNGSTVAIAADTLYISQSNWDAPQDVTKLSRIILPIASAVAGQTFKAAVYNPSKNIMTTSPEVTLAGGETQIVFDISPDLGVSQSVGYQIGILTTGSGTHLKGTSQDFMSCVSAANTYTSGFPSNYGSPSTSVTAWAMSVEYLYS